MKTKWQLKMSACRLNLHWLSLLVLQRTCQSLHVSWSMLPLHQENPPNCHQQGSPFNERGDESNNYSKNILCKMLYLKAVYMTSQHSVMIVCDLLDLMVGKFCLKFFFSLRAWSCLKCFSSNSRIGWNNTASTSQNNQISLSPNPSN